MAHSAHDEESACESAFRVWERLQKWAGEYNAGKQRIFDQVLPTLHGFSSGDDGFETWASLQIGARLPLALTPGEWYQRFDQIAGNACVKPTGYPIPAHLSEKNTPLVRAFLAGVREHGGRPGFVVKTGTADMNIVAPTWGCPVVAYGPGDSALDHSAQEHISVAEYARAVEVLKSVLLRLSSV
jgi:LysW-gamma-L-lysine carboxypeptidase